MINSPDYVIVGSGIAGLHTALRASERGSVLIITKGKIDDCNTRYAQGGIAAAIGKEDSPEVHWKDTIAAGAGLCNEEMVRILAYEAPDRIAELIDLGVPFDTVEGEIALAREAAHSAHRILHAGGDATGKHIELTLSQCVRQSRIKVLENTLATGIVVENGRVKGLKILDCHTQSAAELECRFLILATGGAGQLYKYNTNPEVATGDGVALAFEAGAEITDMEFFQFHPTALRMPGVRSFLISEAVRGEGGILRNISGRRFMPDYAPRAELAPRDVVARAIIQEMQKTGSDKVFLDVTHLPRSVSTTRFPSIYRFCLEHGLDIGKDMIPVAPAAHYMIGGVKINDWGETSLDGLFACGETACAGVHGANRLASNSLLEAVVFSRRILEKAAIERFGKKPRASAGERRYALPARPEARAGSTPTLSALQQLSWENLNITRSGAGLTQAALTLAAWQKSLYAPSDRPSYELKSLVLVGRLVAEAALVREESRGTHFRTDFPETSPEWHRHIVFRHEADALL